MSFDAGSSDAICLVSDNASSSQKSIKATEGDFKVTKRPRATPSPTVTSPTEHSPVCKKTMAGAKKEEGLMDKLEELLNKKFQELTSTLATKADFEALAEKIDNVKEAHKTIKEDLTALKKENSMILERLERLENDARRSNLVFKGILQESTCKDPVDCVRKFCKDSMKIDSELAINRARVVAGTQKNPLIIANITKDQDIKTILSKGYTLAGTPYSVSRDFSFKVRQKRNKLFTIKKELKKITNVDSKVYFDSININGARFDLNDELNLLHKGKCGLEKLREICQTDLPNSLLSTLGTPQIRRGI